MVHHASTSAQHFSFRHLEVLWTWLSAPVSRRPWSRGKFDAKPKFNTKIAERLLYNSALFGFPTTSAILFLTSASPCFNVPRVQGLQDSTANLYGNWENHWESMGPLMKINPQSLSPVLACGVSLGSGTWWTGVTSHPGPVHHMQNGAHTEGVGVSDHILIICILRIL